MKRHIVLKTLLITAAILFAAILIFLIVVISEAPKLDEASVVPDGYLTTVLNDDGETELTLAGAEANRIYVTLDEIPDDLQNAFIAVEDERFYSHHGIDIKGILRAAFKGITTGHFSQGASTITQQLLKNNAFSGWTDENFLQKVERKIQEQYLAVRLEMVRSKEWILENYLNTINLGGGSWGVEAASKRYFGKDVSELTLSECAVLAGITKSPEGYNPLKNPDKSRARQLIVLEDMLEQGYITQEAYQEAVDDDVYTRIEQNHTENASKVYSWFDDALINSVINDLQSECGYSEEEAWDLLYRGGLTIYSTVDSDIQKICEDTVNGDYYTDSEVQASVVVMDVSDGAVKGIVGGRGDKTASLVYNRAVESERQPGSTIKIIGEYASGLQSGLITLGTAFDDCPTTYSDGTAITNASSSYKGMMTVHDAIVKSTNTVALKVFRNAGLSQVFSMLEDFGITTLDEKDQVEALAIGGTNNGVTNLEMTAAYNAIAAQGSYTQPYFYTKIVDHNGKTILEHQSRTKQVISRANAQLLTMAMQDVITEGTGSAAYFAGMAKAGKTGTTNDNKDVWMIGYTPYYTCGVWSGYDSNEAQSGTSSSKAIWKAIMEQIHEDFSWKSFDTDELTTAVICTKCGRLAIDGLCDDTLEGDMTEEAYFTRQTIPDSYCDCHEAVTICTESGMLAGVYCPLSCRETKVYLKTASEGTEDISYVLPELAQEECTQHTWIMDYWFGGNSSGNNSTDGSTDGSDSYGNSYGGDSYGGSSYGGSSYGGDSYDGNYSGGDSADDSTYGNGHHEDSGSQGWGSIWDAIDEGIDDAADRAEEWFGW